MTDVGVESEGASARFMPPPQPQSFPKDVCPFILISKAISGQQCKRLTQSESCHGDLDLAKALSPQGEKGSK